MRDEENRTMSGIAREMTVGEYLDRATEELKRRADALMELKRNLPTGYLERGCSTMAAAFQLDRH